MRLPDMRRYKHGVETVTLQVHAATPLRWKLMRTARRRSLPLLRLTQACTGPSLLMMRVAKTVLVAVALAALFAYALDCSASVTPEDAIQCCQSMPCSSHSHTGEDCCKTMPASHAPFVQTSPVHVHVASSPAVAVLPPFLGSSEMSVSVCSVSSDFHPLPMFRSAAPEPLRI